MRIDWDTVGRIMTRVVGETLGPGRLDDIFEIGADQVSWSTRRHHFLTVVSSHEQDLVVLGQEGRDAVPFDPFLCDRGCEWSENVTAVAMNMSIGDARSVKEEGHTPRPASARARSTFWPWPRRCSGP